jgi:hypothetical protein
MTWTDLSSLYANKALSNLASVAINTTLLPGSSGAIDLGSTSFMWGNLFLKSGGVINWNSGNATLTHSAGLLTSSVPISTFRLYSHDSGTADDAGYGGTLVSTRATTNTGQHINMVRSGTAAWSIGYIYNTSTFAIGPGAVTDSNFIAANAYLTLQSNAVAPGANGGTALGLAANSWSNLFLASGGVINWNNGTYTATQSGSALTLSGTLSLGTAGSVVGDVSLNNATSGSITLRPVTGALGSSVITMPAATDTMAVLAASQAFTNKTYNKVTITAPATSATLTITDGKTLSISNTLTLAGTDSTTMTFPATSSNVLTTGNTATITKGYTVTPYNAGGFTNGQTYTPDPANGNYQYCSITGTVTLAVPASDCAIDILLTNSTATGLTISGSYTAPAAATAAYNTTGTNKFLISVRRINSVSTLTIIALQ